MIPEIHTHFVVGEIAIGELTILFDEVRLTGHVRPALSKIHAF